MNRRTLTAFAALVLALIITAPLGVPSGVRLGQPAHAQGNVFPLPAPLYILTSDHSVLRVDPVGGGQTVVSPIDQPVTDFDIAPDGEWYVYRSNANNAVVVSSLSGMGGYVLEFDVNGPAQSSAAQTIAWSPDASRLAYIVAQGVRIAELGQGQYGEAVLSTIQGAFAELYWLDGQTIIASDAGGSLTRISGSAGQWTLDATSGLPMRPQPVVPSYLTAQGVMLGNTTAIPATAGALAFDWGPLSPPIVAGKTLPTDVTFLAPDAAGVTQVWRLPASGAPVYPVTASPASVLAYDFAPGRERLAYATGDRLYVAALDGSTPRELAVLDLSEGRLPTLAWNPDGRQIATSDARGLWIAAADGSSAPRLVLQNIPFTADTTPAQVRSYAAPLWNADGSRLLVGIGLWESSTLGILDPVNGTLAALSVGNAIGSQWTPDGQIVTYAWTMGSPLSALILIDPAAPDAAHTLLTTASPTADLAPDGVGGWVALIAPSAQIGPQFWRAARAAELGAAFEPLYADALAGTFAAEPVVLPGDPVWAAGLRNTTSTQNGTRGDLVIVDMSSGTTVQIQTTGPVGAVRWLR